MYIELEKINKGGYHRKLVNFYLMNTNSQEQESQNNQFHDRNQLKCVTYVGSIYKSENSEFAGPNPKGLNEDGLRIYNAVGPSGPNYEWINNKQFLFICDRWIQHVILNL